MNEQQLLEHVYDRFLKTGTWPAVHSLQVQLREFGNVRLVAARAGRDKIICEEGQNGVCFLTLRGMALCPAAAEDISNFLGALRYVARAYVDRGRVEIRSAELCANLSLDSGSSSRLRQLLWHNSGIMSGGGYTPGTESFSFVPSDDVYAFEHVDSLDDYFSRLEQVATEAREASRLHWQSTAATAGVAHPEAVVPFIESPVGVPDTLPIRHPDLRRVVERDLAELRRVVAAGAWKAAAVLAGSCLEAALTDLWFRNEQRAKQLWPNKWPSSVSLSDFASEAAKAGFITTVHRDMASAIRSARNLVHPFKSSREPPPSPELVSVLLAALGLLAKELDEDADTPRGNADALDP